MCPVGARIALLPALLISLRVPRQLAFLGSRTASQLKYTPGCEDEVTNVIWEGLKNEDFEAYFVTFGDVQLDSSSSVGVA